MSEDLLFIIPKALEADFVKKGKQGSKYKIVEGKVLGRSFINLHFYNYDTKKYS